MLCLLGRRLLNDDIDWEYISGPWATGWGDDEGIQVTINGCWKTVRDRPVLRRDILERNNVDWLWQDGTTCCLNLDKLRARFDLFKDEDWLSGTARVQPKGQITPNGSYVLTLYKEDYLVARKQRIFLSHKGADKPLVREFYDTLKLLGFDPWLDEEDMTAGAVLHREIQSGFDFSISVAIGGLHFVGLDKSSMSMTLQPFATSATFCSNLLSTIQRPLLRTESCFGTEGQEGRKGKQPRVLNTITFI